MAIGDEWSLIGNVPKCGDGEVGEIVIERVENLVDENLIGKLKITKKSINANFS